MTCALCGGKLERKKVHQEINLGNDRLITTVAVFVCINCHERYFPAEVVDHLIKLKKTYSRNKKRLKSIGKVYSIKTP